MNCQDLDGNSELSHSPGSSDNFPIPSHVGSGIPFPIPSYPSSLSMSSHNGDTISLQELLDGGSKVILSIDESIRDAILLLGNTGGGKTTIGQVIAGNLARLHSILTTNEEVVIVDDDNRIGAPTTLSKTLIPELLQLKPGGGDNNAMTIVDCPGFDDNRGPEQDIASNYFMNQIARRVARVKMLLVLNHSSVKLGNDRLDFDLLVGHAITFLKNFPKYSSGIGLVVNKVCSYNPCGVRLTDQAISRGITEFLKGYVKTQQSKLQSSRTGATAMEDMARRIQFVDALLQPDEDGRCPKIIFSRTPVEIGPLSQSETVLGTREKILQLCDDLKYCPIDSRDFNYSLKEITKRNLEDHVRTVNQVVGEGLTKLVEDFRNFYGRKFLQSKDINVMANELQKSTRTIGLLLDKLESLEFSEALLPKLFLDIVQAYFKGWGYWFPLQAENVMEQHGQVFQFFDEANNHPVWRSIRDWIHPVEQLWRELRELQVWYKFCLDLREKVGSHEWQTEKPLFPGEAPVGMDVDVDWLDYIERECKGQLSDEIRELASRLGGIHLEAVGRIMRFAMRPVEVTLADGGKKMIMTGNYLRLGECMSKFDMSGGNVKRIEIYSAHKLFIDVDVDAEGKELEMIMIAPNWVVVGGERHINLNGSKGPSRNPAVAQDGTFVEGAEGQDGSHGLAGLPGGPGGTFLGIALHTKNIKDLKISSVGGKGGPGQQGGKGAIGGKARDATWDDAVFRKRTDYVSHAIYWYRHEGFPGHPGGNGGDGGVSGVGGNGGNVQFFNHAPTPNEAEGEVQLIMGDGEAGEQGEGGEGGSGGLPGDGTEAYFERRLYGLFRDVGPRCLPSPSKASPGSSGEDGLGGQSSKGQVEGKSSPTIAEWECVVDYKYAMIRKGHRETGQFLQYLEEHPTLQAFMDLDGLRSELEKILELECDMKGSSWGPNFCNVISSYMGRVQTYAQENSQNMTGDDKTLVPYLLLAAHTKLMALDPGQTRAMSTPAGMTDQFKVIKTRMEKLKDFPSFDQIKIEEIRANENMKMNLEEKIHKVKSFLEEVVTPSSLEANGYHQITMDTLGAILNELMIRNRPGVLGMDERDRLSKVACEKERESQIFGQVSSVCGAVVKTTDLIVGIFHYIGKGIELVSGGGREARAPVINPVENLNRSLASWESPPAWGNAGQLEENQFPRSTNDSDVISKLKEMVSQAERKLRAACDRNDFTPVVDAMSKILGGSNYGDADPDPQNQNEPVAPVINPSRVCAGEWQLTSLLWEVKELLVILERRSESKLFLMEIDLLQHVVILVIGLFHDIVNFEWRRSLLEYLAVVSFIPSRNINEVDPSFPSRLLTMMQRATRDNLMEREYREALNTFKNALFPVAQIYVAEDNSSSIEEQDGTMYLRKMEQLQDQLEKYMTNATTLNDPNVPMKQTEFCSGSSASSGPFFIWKQERWSNEISELLSGKVARFKADIRQSPEGMDSIKFHQIKINFKLRAENGGLGQEALNKELENVKVELTHSGVCYYRVQRQYYVMAGESRTFGYTFGEDQQRCGVQLETTDKDDMTQEDMNINGLLSPYTLWIMKLVHVSSDGMIQHGGQQDYFRKLNDFAPFVDLELGGAGIYVDGNTAKGQLLDVDKYYNVDHSITENVHI